MTWSTEFEALMTDTVRVSSLSSFSTDGYLRPVYGSASTYQARWVRKQQLVRTFEGIEEISGSHAWVASTSTFGPSARVVVNGSTVGPILATEGYPDEDGMHHIKLFFGG